MVPAKVLVIEDEESFVEALNIALTREGFSVKCATDGKIAMKIFDEFKPDIVLLDLMLPSINGLDILKSIRTKSQVPVIAVTAKSSELDVVVGLELGADDYVTKPYSLKALVARIRATLRRASHSNLTANSIFKVGNVELNTESHEVLVDGEPVELTLKEFDLLYYLIKSAGKVVSRELLLDAVWGINLYGSTKTLDVHIKRLRKKLGDNSSKPEKITTVRGVGYKYEKPKN